MNISIKVKLFFVFIGWCFKYPLTLRENFQDIKTRYMMETDEEMLQIMKDIDNETKRY